MRIAARPYRTGNKLGVPARGEMGLAGVRGVPRLMRPLELAPETDVASEDRREGVATEDVERERLEMVPVRGTEEGAWRRDTVGLNGSAVASPSVH